MFSTAVQQALAQHLVGEGVDDIIGHHPHVVEDIARIDGVPVFYSLGNYVFDQYFDAEVESGLAILMSIEKEQLVFDLAPVLSKRSVPTLPSKNDAKSFLASLAERSDVSLQSDIVRGTIRASF